MQAIVCKEKLYDLYIHTPNRGYNKTRIWKYSDS